MTKLEKARKRFWLRYMDWYQVFVNDAASEIEQAQQDYQTAKAELVEAAKEVKDEVE